MHYAVSPDGMVRSYKQKSFAEAMAKQVGGFYANDASGSLVAIPTPVLVILHNLVRPERPVTRFADRATAEKRLQGVLEVLAKPGEAPDAVTVVEEPEPAGEVEDDSPLTPEEFTPDPTKTPEENEAMAAAARKNRKKSPAAKKPITAKARAPRVVATIPEGTVKRVIKMRESMGWPEILKELGEKSNNFIHRIRPLMKKLDKSSVLAIGPGSPNYGKGVKKGKKSGK